MTNKKKTCGNCLLFNKEDSVCSVNILVAAEYYELKVKPTDACHWEKIEKELSAEFGETEIPIQQIRIWSDNKNGYIESSR